MSDDAGGGPSMGSEPDAVRVTIWLDDDATPIASYRPPGHFELDTTRLKDGPHRLRIEAVDRAGVPGNRLMQFSVRNGPGISVDGIRDGDVVDGKIRVLVNAYAGSAVAVWEPQRAETPASVPVWAWLLCLATVAWATWYDARYFETPAEFAQTPTYATPAATASP